MLLVELLTELRMVLRRYGFCLLAFFWMWLQTVSLKQITAYVENN